MTKDTLYQQINKYTHTNCYPFHMPGHKRNTKLLDMGGAVGIDITEIDGFDDLHAPEGVIKEAQERAAALFGAGETHFLVNGSTVGLLSAIAACVRFGGRMGMARNCHKAVYHAVLLNGLRPEYIYPKYLPEPGIFEGIRPRDVERLLEDYPDLQAVVVTSPTYEGVLSDVAGISRVCKKYGVPLIVDEAHGAHLGFHECLPGNANRQGADLVIQSVHKTLPSLTQTALLHVNGELVNRKKVKKMLTYYQSSSPSYVLMASIDSCMKLLADEARKWFGPYIVLLEQLRSRVRELKYLRLLQMSDLSPEHSADYDFTKLVIWSVNSAVSGKMLYDWLRETYHLQMEMAAGKYVLGMTSIGDREEGFERLWQALEALDGRIEKEYGTVDESGAGVDEKNDSDLETVNIESLRIGHNIRQDAAGDVADGLMHRRQRMSPYEASLEESQIIALADSAGETCAEYVYLYPPGVPILVPGEEIEQEIIDQIRSYKEMGLNIRGIEDSSCETVQIIPGRPAR